jgi:prepilin-type N-terminal cleavage/methylation domain-containing protein
MRRSHPPRPRSTGFTLLELSIVLILIGLIVGGGLVTVTAAVQKKSYDLTIARMQTIETALYNFRAAFNRIPCPADLTRLNTDANYGLEAGAGSGSSPGTATGACTGGSIVPAANFSYATAAEGAVPVRALRLPDDYMYDGWGNRFRYAVDVNMTAAVAFNTSPLNYACGPISVNDITGSARSQDSIYAIISHGANGHGAYSRAATILSSSSDNTNELINCHCNSSGVSTGYSPVYVQQTLTASSSDANNNFDDIVAYKERSQMITPWDNPTGTGCMLLAVAHSNSPYVTMYTFSNGNLTKLPAPATIPNSVGYTVDFSPDNSLLVWAGATNHATNFATVLYNVTGSGLTGFNSLFPGDPYSASYARFSPDGNYIATAKTTSVDVFQESGGAYTTTGVTGATNIGPQGGYLVWSPDGSILYYKDNHTIYNAYTHSGAAFNAPTSVDYSSAPVLGSGWWQGAFDIDPTGTYLVTSQQFIAGGYYGPIVIKNPTSGPTGINTTTSGLSGASIAMGARWSPDGTMLAVGYYDDSIRVYSFNPAASPPFTAGTISGANCSGYASSIAWSKDSKYLAIGSPTSGGILCLYSRSGTNFTNIVSPAANVGLQPGGIVSGVAWSK